jgi:hypothetical protein
VKSAEFVGWALGGLEREIAQTRERLSALTEHAVKLRSSIGASKSAAGAGEGPEPSKRSEKQPVGRRQRRRQMSPEARQRLSEMMKKRWAQRRKEQG